MSSEPTVSPGDTSATIDAGTCRAAHCTRVWPPSVGMSASAAIAHIEVGEVSRQGTPAAAHTPTSVAPADPYTSAA